MAGRRGCGEEGMHVDGRGRGGLGMSVVYFFAASSNN